MYKNEICFDKDLTRDYINGERPAFIGHDCTSFRLGFLNSNLHDSECVEFETIGDLLLENRWDDVLEKTKNSTFGKIS